MRRQTFDRGAVAAAGLAITRADGWSAVSLRTVAARLHVTPMALYRVVADADELRMLSADEAAATIQPAHTAELTTTLTEWGHAAHTHLSRHRGLATYVAAHWTELPRWLDIVESLLGSAHSEGITGPTAVASTNAVFAYVLARVQLREAAMPTRRGLVPVRQEPSRYPHVTANRSEFARCEADRHFAIGLDAIVSGVLDRQLTRTPE
jgi:AcrR family transcriptional regulator